MIKCQKINISSKKVLIAFFSMILLFTSSAFAKFVDLSNYIWAEDAINSMADMGIINGVGENKFAPSNNVTRQEFAAMAIRAFGGEYKISQLSEYMSKKAETEDNLYTLKEIENIYGADNWSNEVIVASQYFPDIQKLWSCELSNWNENANRAEMAFIVMTIAETLGNEEFEIVDGIDNEIGDISQVLTSDFAYFIFKAYSSGILVGIDNSGNYRPNNLANRAEAACIIQRLVDSSKRIEVVVDDLQTDIISLKPKTIDEIETIFQNAIILKQPKVELDVSDITWKYDVEIDLKNAYFAAISNNTSLKYAYDISFEQDNGKIICKFSYMPYKLGAYKNGIPQGTYEISTLKDIVLLMNEMSDVMPSKDIAIINPNLDIEDIQKTLLPGGYGFVVYTLNNDATKIIATPNIEKDLQSSVVKIRETFTLAENIIDEIITPQMTQTEIVESIYKYITETVKYDWRYYNDPSAMPLTSTTALGALKDGTAICGGYSWAMKTMLDICGIENYTVSGKLGNEYHAWNYVIIDGKGYYCDPTSDRGGGLYWFMLSEEELYERGKHIWDINFYSRLSGITSKTNNNWCIDDNKIKK